MSSDSLAAAKSSGPSLPSFFERYQPLIAAALRDELEPHDLPLYTTLRYYLGWVDPDGNPDPKPEGRHFDLLSACSPVSPSGEILKTLFPQQLRLSTSITSL